MTSTTTFASRGPTPLGGFNLTALRLEITRVLRNRRTLFFIIVFPSVFFFMFRSTGGRSARAQADVIAAYVMISMAVYGAMVGTTSGGATVAIERSLGWSRQLRLTPLNPLAYVVMKVLTSMTLGLLAVCSTFTIGAISGVHMAPQTWLLAGLAAWVSSLVFAAFGLLVGFLFPAENVMQFVGPLMAVMAMFGGIFVPLNQLPQGLQDFARYTPMYGVGIVARAPLVGGATTWAVASILVWTVIFAFGAMTMYRRDTARV
jgi:ABC-2 type transport system permease protein